MAIEIVQTVIDEVEALVADIKNELGSLSHAVALSLKYDAEKFWALAKAAATTGLTIAVELTRQHLTDFWITIKDQAVAAWASLSGDFEQKLVGLLGLLGNIQWATVGAGLVGISESTLLTAARAAAQMLITGVLAAA